MMFPRDSNRRRKGGTGAGKSRNLERLYFEGMIVESSAATVAIAPRMGGENVSCVLE
jgi:hypothetical protein